MPDLELFRCVPLGCRLTRAACAARSVTARAPGRAGVVSLASSACVDCEIGAAHRKGESPATWPDGASLEVTAIASASSGPPPAPKRKSFVYEPRRAASFGLPIAATAPAPAPKEDPMAETRTITAKGQTLTLKEWAGKLGCTDAAIRMRLKKGWTEEAAVTTPLGAASGKGSTRPPSEKGAKPSPKPKAKPTPKAPPRARTPEPDPVLADMRAIVGTLDPADLLTRLGWVVGDMGTAPSGHRILVIGVRS